MNDLFLLSSRPISASELIAEIPPGYICRQSYHGGLAFSKNDDSYIVVDPQTEDLLDWKEIASEVGLKFCELCILRVWTSERHLLFDLLPFFQSIDSIFADNDHGVLVPLRKFIEKYEKDRDWDWGHATELGLTP